MWKVSVFGVTLVFIFPHSDWIWREIQSECGKIRTRITPTEDNFYAEYMKENSNKSHLLMPGNKAIANINNNHVESEDMHELPGITIDWELIFETHVNKLCWKANQKLNALAWISNYMTFDKRKTIMKALVTSLLCECSTAKD